MQTEDIEEKQALEHFKVRLRLVLKHISKRI